MQFYNALRLTAHVGLPVLGLVFSLLNADEVLGGIIVLILILGVTLEIISRRYDSEGELVVTEDEDGNKSFSLQLEKEPEELAEMDRVVFNVQK